MSSSAEPAARQRLDPGERRGLIVQAAEQQFAAHGYDQASMRAIAKAAGVTTPVLYDHFEAKADLYRVVLQAHADALIAHWAVPLPRGAPEQLFLRSVDAFLVWIEENELGWRMLFLDSPAEPSVALTHRAIQDRATQASAALFAQLSELNTSASLDRARLNELLGEAIKTALNGVAIWWWENRDVSRQDVLALTTDLLWGGLERLTAAGSA
jgi:AcrR family transcriptional regulator